MGNYIHDSVYKAVYHGTYYMLYQETDSATRISFIQSRSETRHIAIVNVTHWLTIGAMRMMIDEGIKPDKRPNKRHDTGK